MFYFYFILYTVPHHLVDSDTDMLFVQGVLEAIRISCLGYPTRRTFEEFVDRFGVLLPEVLGEG
jgi:hypothetical protein